MTTRHIQAGKVLDYVNTTGAAIASGAGVLIGTKFGVALVAIAIGATGSVQICSVFSQPKLSADTMAQGALVYWDNTNKRLTTTSAGNTLAGVAATAAANGDATVNVLLNGTPG